MLIDIDPETLDDIVRKVLVEDWKRVRHEVRSLKNKETLLPHHEEDLKDMKKVKKAYETLIRYTHKHDEAFEILGKREK